jgi:uncharacterized protein (TIRG00374 family)
MPLHRPGSEERDHRRITSRPPDASPRSRRKTGWRIVRLVVSLALAAFALHVVYGQRDELAGATSYLDNIAWQWLAVAAVVEVASMASLAALQRRLLMAGKAPIPLGTSTAIAFAGNAIQNSLPAGPVFSSIFAFRQFHRRGADDVLAGWTLVGTAALLDIALVVLAVVGLAGASGTGSGLDLVTVILGLLVMAALLVLLWSRRNWVAGHMVGPLRLVQRFVKRPTGDPEVVVEEFVRRMNAISPSKTDWVMMVIFALANWAFDVGCLIAAFMAVGAPVPWRALLLAYAAAQLAANLPITPGGLGVVEGSLIIGLVAYGGGQESTVAAVLLYRLLSFWALLPLGWMAWAYSNWDLRRLEGHQRSLMPGSSEPMATWQAEGAT